MTKQRKAGSLLFTLMLCGCQISGAPSLEIVGAFFPAWLLCAVAGIAAAGISRIVQVSSGRADLFPYPLLLCTAIGTIAGLLLWLIVFGR